MSWDICLSARTLVSTPLEDLLLLVISYYRLMGLLACGTHEPFEGNKMDTEDGLARR